MPTTVTQPLPTPNATLANDAPLPPTARPTSGMNPLHSGTASTMAPTSEFTRLFLLGWMVRYIFRGAPKEVFSERTFDVIRRPITRMVEFFAGKSARRIEQTLAKAEHQPAIRHLLGKDEAFLDKFFQPQHSAATGATQPVWESGQKLYKALRPEIRRWRGKPTEDITEIMRSVASAPDKAAPVLSASNLRSLSKTVRAAMDDMAYSLSLGVGSSILSLTYSAMVRRDIRNMFSEVVAYEKGISPDQVTFSDIAASDNRIIQRTVNNYRIKLAQRLGTDALFFAAAPLKSEGITDVLLGVKGVQIFAETWKRTPTLFEDIVTLVNNKINPRNGLGQPVTVGEIFDLYQHYTEQFTPAKMFHNVLERGSGEGAVWAESQPIFQRITELMNLTYAYKHPTVLDAAGQTLAQANFQLPKLIYLLGHDLIDPREPARTLTYLEVANRYGMEEVRAMATALANGASLNDIWAKYPAAKPAARAAVAPTADPINSITQVNHPEKSPQLKASPETTVDAASGELQAAREKFGVEGVGTR
jgi:hypothetical protein